MPTIQNLKKKLQVILSTKKITQAMKTAATIKYSKLSGTYTDFEKYADQCNCIYQAYCNEFNSLFPFDNTDAPALYILLSANKGMCGSFNNELMNYFEDIISKQEKSYLVLCSGKKGEAFLESKKIPCEEVFLFDDVPSYSDVYKLFEKVMEYVNAGTVSAVKVVYPQYVNMIKQTPVCEDLFDFSGDSTKNEDSLFIPDKQTVLQGAVDKILACIIYKKVLETAIGAQAATLTTMRSAYDTACEYSAQLETQINRKRQSQVTADVIEISSEYSMNGEE